MTEKEAHISHLIKQRITEKDPEAQVILFGSHARGEANRHSDWDVLILLKENAVSRSLEKEYREQLFDVALEMGEPISTYVFSKSEWETKHFYTPFYENVNREGVVL
jgi:predicted nucleotidyltransferase